MKTVPTGFLPYRRPVRRFLLPKSHESSSHRSRIPDAIASAHFSAYRAVVLDNFAVDTETFGLCFIGIVIAPSIKYADEPGTSVILIPINPPVQLSATATVWPTIFQHFADDLFHRLAVVEKTAIPNAAAISSPSSSTVSAAFGIVRACSQMNFDLAFIE